MIVKALKNNENDNVAVVSRDIYLIMTKQNLEEYSGSSIQKKYLMHKLRKGGKYGKSI